MLSIYHFVNLPLVNSHLVNVDKVEVEVDKTRISLYCKTMSKFSKIVKLENKIQNLIDTVVVLYQPACDLQQEQSWFVYRLSIVVQDFLLPKPDGGKKLSNNHTGNLVLAG